MPASRYRGSCQSSTPESFARFTGTPLGLLQAIKVIYGQQGPMGLFQGHSATLLRIFPYAAIKFMAYERLEGVSGVGRRKYVMLTLALSSRHSLSCPIREIELPEGCSSLDLFQVSFPALLS
jgi:hypothetical protein